MKEPASFFYRYFLARRLQRRRGYVFLFFFVFFVPLCFGCVLVEFQGFMKGGFMHWSAQVNGTRQTRPYKSMTPRRRAEITAARRQYFCFSLCYLWYGCVLVEFQGFMKGGVVHWWIQVNDTQQTRPYKSMTLRRRAEIAAALRTRSRHPHVCGEDL